MKHLSTESGIRPLSTGLFRSFAIIAFLSVMTSSASAAITLLADPTSSSASSSFAGDVAGWGPQNLYDLALTDADVNTILAGGNGAEYAGSGLAPHVVVFDHGAPVTFNGFAYAQRGGGADPVADKVPSIDFWVTDTDPGAASLTLPILSDPIDASASNLDTLDLRFRAYDLGTELTGQYVVMRLNGGGTGNPGGGELGLLSGEINELLRPRLEIDRDTGSMTLMNDSGAPLNFNSYQIDSTAAGALDASNWNSIAANYDAGSPGPNQVDSTDDWIEFTPAPFIGTLAEGELPGGDGATLPQGGSIDLGTAWIRNPIEDVEITVLLADGSDAEVQVVYVGDEIVVGDFNDNGMVDAPDWPLFRTNLGSNAEGLSLAQSYQLGDFDQDGDTDIRDFRAFEQIYDAANGVGALSALIASVPEPSSLVLLSSCCVFFGVRRRLPTARMLVLLLLTCFFVVPAQNASAQVFTLSTPTTPSTATANSEFPGFGVANLFDDATVVAGDIGTKVYDGSSTQYAGVGIGPMDIFLDYGSTISVNYIAYGQRVGGDENADKVGMIEVWFSDTDFGAVVPATPADGTAVVTERGGLFGAYSLGDTLSGRYVAARLTIADSSLQNSPVNNIGGSELRLAAGPSDIVLEVDRTTGEISIRNDGTDAQALDINGYEVRSEGGSLVSSWAGFEDGSIPGFDAGNGSGNGWEKGDASNSELLTEAFLLNTSTLSINGDLSLGTGYDTGVDAQDLEFSVSVASGAGLLLSGRVEYVGAPATGDFDNDNDVDGADFLTWQRGFPGTFDAGDLTNWQNSYGTGSSSSVSAVGVPEPSAWILGLVLGMMLVVVRHRRAVPLAYASYRPVAAGGLAVLLSSSFAVGGTADAIYLFGDNSAAGNENGSAGVEVGQGAGADVPGFTVDHAGDLSVTTTFRDLGPNPDTAGQRPTYVNTAALSYPGTALGSTTTGIGIQLDGTNDYLRGPGLGFPEDGDDNFTGSFESAYERITTRLIDGWVRPANSASGSRQDIVNDTYQFGIHITSSGTWGMNFGSDAGTVDTATFDTGVSVASTVDANGWAHVQHRTLGAGSGALYVNGQLLLLTPVGAPFYHASGGAPVTAQDLDITFGANLTGDGNFFGGEIDNFRLIVAGNNTRFTDNGMNYGRVDLSTDNDYIAANHVRGDANGDGVVNGNGTGAENVDDVTFFVNHFLDEQTVTDTGGNSRVLGDINSITSIADLDGSGTTDIFDWYILRQEHIDSAAIAAVNLGELLAARSIPEPTSGLLAIFSLAAMMTSTRRRR